MWGEFISSHAAHKLSALFVKKTNKPGKYSDGLGLYLIVEPTGSKRWEQRLTIKGKRCDLGLGSTKLVTLEEARLTAQSNKKTAKGGGDPRQLKKLQEGERLSFYDVTLSAHQVLAPTFKSEKYAEQWLATLDNHVFKVIGHKPISSITSADILSVLAPIWTEKTDTAKKLKQRLSYIMKWAKAQAYYTGDNPVELAEQALPRLKASESHFKALPYTEIHNIITALQSLEIQTSTKLSLQFLILTASRQKEVLNARWDEIDFNLNKWVVPANRMKAGKEHEVPLSKQALKILQDAKLNDGDSPLLFPSSATGKPLSDNTLRLVLQKRLQLDTTTHGLRSSFKDWASETTHYPNEVSEMALAHSIPNAVEAAYRRGNLFEKRRQLMNDWAAYLYGQQSEVIQLVRGSTA